jgi:hypothetical protein
MSVLLVLLAIGVAEAPELDFRFINSAGAAILLVDFPYRSGGIVPLQGETYKW